jgi:hypothetical protein
MPHTPATAGPNGTGTANDPLPLFLFAERKLCDDCYEQVTGLPAECLDLCSLSLNHAGLCDPHTETDQPCDRCGETGHRLTEHEPQDAVQAADCLPLDILARIAHLEAVAAGCSTVRGDGHCDDADCPLCEPARDRELEALRDLAAAEFEVTYWVPTQYRAGLNAVRAATVLRRAGSGDAAVTALRIATGDITEGDATDDGGDDLGCLAYAVAKASDQLGVAGPEGEASDWDTPETYHVHVLAARLAPGAGSEAPDGQA